MTIDWYTPFISNVCLSNLLYVKNNTSAKHTIFYFYHEGMIRHMLENHDTHVYKEFSCHHIEEIDFSPMLIFLKYSFLCTLFYSCKNHQMLMDSLSHALKRDVSGHTQHVIDFLFFLRNFLFLWEKRIPLLFVIMLSIITFHIIFKRPCNTVSLKPFDQFRGQISVWYIYLICHVYFYFLFCCNRHENNLYHQWNI